MTWFDEAMGNMTEEERNILLSRVDEIRDEADRRLTRGGEPSLILIDICREILAKERG